jgi:chromosome segregation ATPase
VGSEHEELRKSSAKLKARFEELEREINAHKAALSDKDNDLRRLRGHLQEVQTEYEAQIDELRNAKISALEPSRLGASNQSQSEIIELQKALSEIQREKEEEIEIRTLHLRKENLELKSKLEWFTTVEKENADLRKETSELKSKFIFIQNENRMNLDDVQRLKEENATVRRALEEATKHLATGSKKNDMIIDSRVAARLIVSYVSASTPSTRNQVLPLFLVPTPVNLSFLLFLSICPPPHFLTSLFTFFSVLILYLCIGLRKES